MPRPLLCATVTATTMAELLQRRDAVTGADLVELRLDGVADVDVDGALAGRRLPVIATCRAASAGRTVRRRRGDTDRDPRTGLGSRRGVGRRRRRRRRGPGGAGRRPAHRPLASRLHRRRRRRRVPAGAPARLRRRGREARGHRDDARRAGRSGGARPAARRPQRRAGDGRGRRRLAHPRRSRWAHAGPTPATRWPPGSSRWPACATSSACRRSARARGCSACSAGRSATRCRR